MTPNAGFSAGIGAKSPQQRIGWALKGAPLRKKDLRLSPLAAVVEARKLRDKVSTLMAEAGANPEDAIVLCVFALRGLADRLPVPITMNPQDPSWDLAAVAEHQNETPIGFLVFVIDRADPARPIIGHARPLIVQDPRGLALNAKALQMYTQLIRSQLIATGTLRSN